METGRFVIPHVVKKNWVWKLASLAVAVTLWLMVVGEPQFVTLEAVPLVYAGLAPDMGLASDPPDSVRLELRGPSREVDRGNLSQLKVLLNFGGVKEPGERTFTISDSEVNLPQGVTLQRAIP